jgi:hypothetical protein
MRVDDSIALLTAVNTARARNLIQAWRVGQILEAVVERVTNVGNSTLNVNDQSVDVRTVQPLAVGAKLALEVAQTGAQVVLRVLQVTPPKQPIADTIRALLPRQASLEPVLTRLASWTPPAPEAPPPAIPTRLAPANIPPAAPPPAFPPPPVGLTPRIAMRPAALQNAPAAQPVLDLARKFIDRLPTPRELQTPDALREAIKNAGPFFERKLAAGAPPPDIDAALDGDLKAGLLRLADVLGTLTRAPGTSSADAEPSAASQRPAPQRAAPRAHAAPPRAEPIAPELLALEDDVRAALARVTLHQLASLPQDESSPPQWLLDIPVRNGERFDIVHLHVFREPKPRDPRYPPAWCVRLSFDLATLGPIDVLVTYFALAVSVSVWARESATAMLFERHLEQLKTRLLADGVHLNHMHCECGPAPFAHDPVRALKHHSLIDERA